MRDPNGEMPPIWYPVSRWASRSARERRRARAGRAREAAQRELAVAGDEREREAVVELGDERLGDHRRVEAERLGGVGGALDAVLVAVLDERHAVLPQVPHAARDRHRGAIMPRPRAVRRYGAAVAPKRSYSRIAGLSILGVLIVVGLGAWLLATPSDEYVLLPDDPHPADAVVSVGGVKPRLARDGSGIYYLDVLVHRASLPESWLARFEDGADVVPAAAIVPPGGSQRDLDRVDHLTFQDSRTVAESSRCGRSGAR